MSLAPRGVLLVRRAALLPLERVLRSSDREVFSVPWQRDDEVPARRRTWLVGLILIVLVGLAIKEPELLLPIGPDQGTYGYVAERILQGQLPYVDAWDNKPPGTYYLHAAVLALVPQGDRWAGTCIEGTTQPCGYVALQVVDFVWALLTAVAVLALARALGFGPLGSIASALLFVVYANVSQLSKEGSTPEKQLLLPMVLSYLCVVRARGRPGLLALGGVLAGSAFLFKQTAISIPIALGAFWLTERPLWFGPRAWLPFALGYALPLLFVGGYFAAHGGLDELWDAAFGYNLVQARTNAFSIPRAALTGAWHVFSGSTALLWLLGLGGALIVLARRRSSSSTLMLLLWWAVADALSLALGGAKFAQVYFVQLVPSLALLGGLAIDTAWQATRGMTLLRAYGALFLAAVFMLSSEFQATVALACVERAHAWPLLDSSRTSVGRPLPGRRARRRRRADLRLGRQFRDLPLRAGERAEPFLSGFSTQPRVRRPWLPGTPPGASPHLANRTASHHRYRSGDLTQRSGRSPRAEPVELSRASGADQDALYIDERRPRRMAGLPTHRYPGRLKPS